ncbi:MAG: hypothetical protein KatS3mg058_1683 [Roseiflexus sp.]|nr:MAG: hypothetical protein KatS3mg058_1683 [Roseiflexus sp.]
MARRERKTSPGSPRTKHDDPLPVNVMIASVKGREYAARPQFHHVQMVYGMKAHEPPHPFR